MPGIFHNLGLSACLYAYFDAKLLKALLVSANAHDFLMVIFRDTQAQMDGRFHRLLPKTTVFFASFQANLQFWIPKYPGSVPADQI
jgi:hypothetical protein